MLVLRKISHTKQIIVFSIRNTINLAIIKIAGGRKTKVANEIAVGRPRQVKVNENEVQEDVAGRGHFRILIQGFV